MTLYDALTDAIATEYRREWLSPDEVAEMVEDVLKVLPARCIDGYSNRRTA